jgi:hypothetical protein
MDVELAGPSSGVFHARKDRFVLSSFYGRRGALTMLAVATATRWIGLALGDGDLWLWPMLYTVGLLLLMVGPVLVPSVRRFGSPGHGGGHEPSLIVLGTRLPESVFHDRLRPDL